MSNYNNDTEVDFLDELSPLSEPIMDIPTQPPIAYADRPMGSCITISSVTCFKRFETRFLNGIGDANRDTMTFETKNEMFSLAADRTFKSFWNIAFYLAWT